MDITYIRMSRGFVYLAIVLDWFSRRLLASRLSVTTEASFCVEAFEAALAHHGNGSLIPADAPPIESGHPVQIIGTITVWPRCSDGNGGNSCATNERTRAASAR
jgi:transposase InsO family protein